MPRGARAGLHPPQLRCYETSQLGMKFERHSDAAIVDLCCLSEDFSKFVLMRGGPSKQQNPRPGLLQRPPLT